MLADENDTTDQTSSSPSSPKTSYRRRDNHVHEFTKKLFKYVFSDDESVVEELVDTIRSLGSHEIRNRGGFDLPTVTENLRWINRPCYEVGKLWEEHGKHLVVDVVHEMRKIAYNEEEKLGTYLDFCVTLYEKLVEIRAKDKYKVLFDRLLMDFELEALARIKFKVE